MSCGSEEITFPKNSMWLYVLSPLFCFLPVVHCHRKHTRLHMCINHGITSHIVLFNILIKVKDFSKNSLSFIRHQIPTSNFFFQFLKTEQDE